MSYNTVFSEAEYAKTLNGIKDYTDDLLSGMQTYRTTLSSLLSDGLEAEFIDEAFRKHILELNQEVLALEKELSKISPIAEKAGNEIDAADNFRYPDEVLAAVSSFLAQFF